MSIVYSVSEAAHIGWFYNAVGALIPEAVKVYVGSVPDRPEYPYIVLWGDLGEETSEALADEPDEMRIRFRVTYVGLTLGQVAWLVGKVRPALNRATPSVPGWHCGKLRQAPLMDLQADTSVTVEDGNHPMYSVDEFALVADKL